MGVTGGERKGVGLCVNRRGFLKGRSPILAKMRAPDFRETGIPKRNPGHIYWVDASKNEKRRRVILGVKV